MPPLRALLKQVHGEWDRARCFRVFQVVEHSPKRCCREGKVRAEGVPAWLQNCVWVRTF